MGATIRDVAKKAGVSVATVSRVFNDSGPVSKKTRQTVREAARRLGYAPNGTARSLTRRKTETLGVLLPDLHGEFFTEVIRGIDEVARARGYHVLMSGSRDEETETRAVLQALRGRIDGLFLMSARIDAHLFESLLPDGFPTVLMYCQTPADSPYDVINVDNYGGAYAMVNHLLQHGHRRIAMIKGPADHHDAHERLRGYRDALRAAGADQDAALELEGDFMKPTGYRLAAELLRQPAPPTALFAANDAMAIGALSALHAARVRVPEDVAVAGFDDIPSARYTSPPLSTVRAPTHEMSVRAAHRLIDHIDGGGAPSGPPQLFPTTLQLRASCGCGT